MLSVAVSFGQSGGKNGYARVKQEPVSRMDAQPAVVKSGGDVFWSTTFNWGDPVTREWSLPDGWTNVDKSDLGNPWMWRSPYDTMQTLYTKMGPAPNFITPLDGYILVPADEYNYRDSVETFNVMDTYIMTPPINCSSKTSVTVKFRQNFRTCCAASRLMQMLVTNDAGVHWASYDCRFGVANNTVTPERYQNVEFNISDVAAGMANVQIRFYWQGSDSYYWMIDDLSLSEAYQNDLILVDYWSEFNGGFDERIGHINYWPKTQMGMASQVAGTIGDYSFKGAFLNNGMTDQENVKLQMTILRNGEQVYQDVSNPVPIWSLERDTSEVNSVFLANDYGDYQFKFDAISDNAEEVPINNSIIRGFTVTDSLFHRADFSAESGSNTGGWVGGGNAGDMVGVFYDIYEPCEINSISAYIYSLTMAQVPTFQFILQKYVNDDDIFEVITSDIVEATEDQAKTWVTLNMGKDGESEFLQPGRYIACVKFWGTLEGDTDGTNGMTIGWDMDIDQNAYTYNYQSSDGGWFNTGKVNLIGINISATGGPTQAPATFNVDMTKHIASGEFKPGTDFLDVAGTFNNWSGSAHLTDPEADGIYTITLDGIPVGKVIEYKYRINGNWNTSEYPGGGPNRKYTVRYWNVLNDTYNSGLTSGIDQNGLTATFSVYPNPTAGAITVDITRSTASDLTITLSDIRGQVIYRNLVTGVINHKETIDRKLPAGLYLLNVTDGREVQVKKVVVQ
jgi:hypothetical protein